jgi:hypothetical protein
VRDSCCVWMCLCGCLLALCLCVCVFVVVVWWSGCCFPGASAKPS